MRNLTIAVLSMMVLSACCEMENSKQLAPAEIEATADSLLDNWHMAATEADYATYIGLMDSNSVFIGTDATERWEKVEFDEFCKPYFDKGETWDFKSLERNIYVSSTGEVVWFDEILLTSFGTCRGSGVMEKAGSDWKIKQYVLSMAIPNDVVNEVIEVARESDSVFLSKYNAVNSD